MYLFARLRPRAASEMSGVDLGVQRANQERLALGGAALFVTLFLPLHKQSANENTQEVEDEMRY